MYTTKRFGSFFFAWHMGDHLAVGANEITRGDFSRCTGRFALRCLARHRRPRGRCSALHDVGVDVRDAPAERAGGTSRARRVVSRPPHRAGARVAPRRPPRLRAGELEGGRRVRRRRRRRHRARGARRGRRRRPGRARSPEAAFVVREDLRRRDLEGREGREGVSGSLALRGRARWRARAVGPREAGALPVRAWLAAIPAKRKAERLEGLLLAAEADRDSFVKQDAYMRELALEEMWDEVVARFESRTAASGPGSVVAYLRAMAATGRLEAMDGMDARALGPDAQLSMAAAGVMRDENVTGEQAVAAVTEAVAVAAAERSAARDADRPFEPRARASRARPNSRRAARRPRAAARRRRAGGGATTRSKTRPARPKTKARSGAAG